MENATHERFAARVNDHMPAPLPGVPLVRGATDPNNDPQWPTPHHMSQRNAASAMQRSARQARQEFLDGNRVQAAYQFGVTTHYALDVMVPYGEDDPQHAYFEGEFDAADQRLDYGTETPAGLADAQVVQRAIRRIVAASSRRPVDRERRLRAAYANLLRIGVAITQPACPKRLQRHCRKAYNELVENLQPELQRYQDVLRSAVLEGLEEVSPDGKPLTGNLWRRVMARHEALCGQGRSPALHLRLATLMAHRRFRATAGRAIDDAFQSEGHHATFAAECAALRRQYEERIESIAEHYETWDWFRVPWDEWEEKGEKACEVVFQKAADLREQLIEVETVRFRDECLDQFEEHWRGSLSHRLTLHLRSHRWARVLLPLLPALVLIPVFLLLWWGGAASPLAAGIVLALVAAALGLYIGVVVRDLQVLTGYAESAAPTRAETPNGEAGRSREEAERAGERAKAGEDTARRRAEG
ncbi:MAG: zinc dependent phospholipase C family protein [Candidatus Brocadiia bacterium]